VKIGGSGLAGVAARGGRFEAGPAEGGGYRLRVALPVGGRMRRRKVRDTVCDDAGSGALDSNW
jgi:hypothetical protein